MKTSTTRRDIYARVVRKFSATMLRQLRENRHKGTSWRHDDTDVLHVRLLEELDELLKAIDQGASPTVVQLEAADVANFALMIADAYALDYDR